MNKIRNETHTRCDFARLEFDRYSNLLSIWTKTKGSLIGNNPQKYLEKLNQCNRIWHFYCEEFSRTLKLINSPISDT